MVIVLNLFSYFGKDTIIYILNVGFKIVISFKYHLNSIECEKIEHPNGASLFEYILGIQIRHVIELKVQIILSF